MEPSNAENCKKKTVVIDGENFYLAVGKNFAQVTVPRENDPFMTQTRKVAETLCREITLLQGGAVLETEGL